MAIRAPNRFGAQGRSPIQLAFQLRDRQRARQSNSGFGLRDAFSAFRQLSPFLGFGGPSLGEQAAEATRGPTGVRMPLETQNRGLPFGGFVDSKRGLG